MDNDFTYKIKQMRVEKPQFDLFVVVGHGPLCL